MKAPEKTSDQLPAGSPRGPVFVDASGRRLRRVQLIGLGVLGLVAGYVVLVLAAFIGGSGVSAPFLPLPAAAGPHDQPSIPPSSPAADSHTAAALSGPAAPPVEQSPAAVPVALAAAPAAPPVGGTAVATSAPVSAPVPAASTQPGLSGTAPGAAGTAPGSSGTAPGTSGVAPGSSGVAPGQATRPSAPSRQ
ncbi:MULTISPECIES: hypothetical protein [unclassified Arthrobacter]|jgi:hypothetical protein|uniref:hypothetical protein n=1 Tax=unclassified Arthrobacter TaxID=235627 RepID=UPI00037B0FD0|nr:MULTISPECIES: hypothetical protein [unclassified Arthrobacter]